MSHRETLKRPGRMMRAGLVLAGAVFLVVCVTANQVHAAPITFNATTPTPTNGTLSGTFTMTFDFLPSIPTVTLNAWMLTVDYTDANGDARNTIFSGSTAINLASLGSNFELTNSDPLVGPLDLRPINNSSGAFTQEWDPLGGTFQWQLFTPPGTDFQVFAVGRSSSYSPVPEPGTALLVATGLIVLVGYRWQLRRHEKTHFG